MSGGIERSQEVNKVTIFNANFTLLTNLVRFEFSLRLESNTVYWFSSPLGHGEHLCSQSQK